MIDFGQEELKMNNGERRKENEKGNFQKFEKKKKEKRNRKKKSQVCRTRANWSRGECCAHLGNGGGEQSWSWGDHLITLEKIFSKIQTISRTLDIHEIPILPRFFFISMNFEQFPGSFHIWWCWWDSLQTSSTSAEMVRGQARCHHRWQKIHIRKFLSGCNLYFIHTISMSPPLSKNIYVHIPCQHITDCKNISSQRISFHHFSKRRPLDATRQPGKGASNRLSCSRKTSHLQPANHL